MRQYEVINCTTTDRTVRSMRILSLQLFDPDKCYVSLSKSLACQTKNVFTNCYNINTFTVHIII